MRTLRVKYSSKRERRCPPRQLFCRSFAFFAGATAFCLNLSAEMPGNAGRPDSANSAAVLGNSANDLDRGVIYSAAGKRDPFREPKVNPVEREIAGNSPLEKFSIDQLVLRAIVKDSNKSHAMVEDPEGHSHLLTEGDLVGKEHGTVSRILRTAVIVSQKTYNYRGVESLFEKVLYLPQQEEDSRNGVSALVTGDKSSPPATDNSPKSRSGTLGPGFSGLSSGAGDAIKAPEGESGILGSSTESAITNSAAAAAGAAALAGANAGIVNPTADQNGAGGQANPPVATNPSAPTVGVGGGADPSAGVGEGARSSASVPAAAPIQTTPVAPAAINSANH